MARPRLVTDRLVTGMKYHPNVLGCAAAVTLLVVPVLSACGSGPAAPKLVWGADHWNGSGNHYPGPVSTPFTFGAMDPCVTSGSVTVIGFAFTTSSGLVLTGWGSRPNPFIIGKNMQGGTSRRLVNTGFTVGPATIDDSCDVEGAPVGDEFAIEMYRTSAATGWANGLTVSYRSGTSKKVRTSYWDLGFALCGNTVPPDDRLANLCH